MATLSTEGLQQLLEKVGVDGAIPAYRSADALNSPMDLYRSYLAETLVHLTKCEPEVAYNSIHWPGDQADLMVVLPRLRLPNSNWDELANQLMPQFPASPLFGFPFADGVHVRLLFSPTTLAQILLPYILDHGSSYGKDLSAGLRDIHDSAACSSRQRVIVEFSSPNLGKEFKGMYLRSTVIGAFVAAFYQSMGFEVHKTNFLGDWGKHIGLLAIGWSRFGSEENFRVDPLRHLLDVFTKIEQLSKAEQQGTATSSVEGEVNLENGVINISTEKDEFFKRMEEGDESALELCKRFREACITRYAELYASLGVVFDEYSGESLVSHETIAEVEANLREKGILEQKDDAWVIDFAKHESKKIGTGIFRYRDGTTTYLLRDVAGTLERSRMDPFDQMLYVVSIRQEPHFQQLFRTLELMGHTELVKKLHHFSFGEVKDVSAREGSSGVLLEDILEQNRNSVEGSLSSAEDNCILEKSEDTADASEALDTLSAIVLGTQILSARRSSILTINLGQTASTERNTGLSIYQCLSKLRSKLSSDYMNKDEHFDDTDYSVFKTEEYADVLRILAQFPGIVKSAFKPLDSSTIISYLIRVAEQMQLVWDFENEDTAEETRTVIPSAFYRSVELVLENGLSILGMDAGTRERPEVGNHEIEQSGDPSKVDEPDKLDEVE